MGPKPPKNILTFVFVIVDTDGNGPFNLIYKLLLRLGEVLVLTKYSNESNTGRKPKQGSFNCGQFQLLTYD